MKDKITMLVNTCDKNSFLWKPFSTLFDIYWDKDIEIKKYILGETQSGEVDGFEFMLPGKNSWADNVLYALDRIETEYVFWWLDDYFMVSQMPAEALNTLFYWMNFYNAQKLVFHYPHAELILHPLEPEYRLFRMAQNSPYTTTLQPSIWKVDHFKSCILRGETPWQFEIDGTVRLNTTNHKILLHLLPDRWHYEGLSRGQRTPDYFRILNEHGLYHLIDTTEHIL